MPVAEATRVKPTAQDVPRNHDDDKAVTLARGSNRVTTGKGHESKCLSATPRLHSIKILKSLTL